MNGLRESSNSLKRISPRPGGDTSSLYKSCDSFDEVSIIEPK